MIKQIHNISNNLLSKLSEASHGAMPEDIIKEYIEGNSAMIISINDRLTTGLMWDENVLAFFGFFGEMKDEDLEELNEYSMMIANEKGVSKIQFLTPRTAWARILKKFNYKTALVVYDKEI